MARYIYGPVASRRLGSSLGVDLVPLKTCSYDCIYCQLGPDEHTTVERKDYAPVDAVLEEVAEALQGDVLPDYITLSGSGEPTLHRSIGRIVDGIRDLTGLPICLLTNGSMLSLPEVRNQCRRVDLAVPNLDAPNEAVFRKINRPHQSLHFPTIVEGLVQFRREFEGKIWLELFVVPGLNDSPDHIREFKRLIDRIDPDCVHLNTAVRPPADKSVRMASNEQLEDIRRQLGTKAEIIAAFDNSSVALKTEVKSEDVLNMVGRRPCTVGDLAEGLSANPAVIVKCLQRLQRKAAVEQCYRDAKVYYRASKEL